jgi:hypothetical protein
MQIRDEYLLPDFYLLVSEEKTGPTIKVVESPMGREDAGWEEKSR